MMTSRFIQDYSGLWHRVSRIGVDYWVTLCGEYVRPDQWGIAPPMKDARQYPEPMCGECRV